MAIESVRAVYFPYCIQKQEDGSWVLLNRNYKPVGFNTDEYMTYSDYPVSMRLKGLGPATLKKLSYSGESQEGMVYLYNDANTPDASSENMKLYLKKLEILLKLQRDRA